MDDVLRAFLTVFPAELPDKSMVATIVLVTRYHRPMAVWLGRDATHVRPTLEPTFTSKAKVSVSFARGGMDPSRLNDQQMPRNATDGFAANVESEATSDGDTEPDGVGVPASEDVSPDADESSDSVAVPEAPEADEFDELDSFDVCV